MQKKTKTFYKKRFSWKLILKYLFFLTLAGLAVVFGINTYICSSTKSRILSAEEAGGLTDVDCILVLGAGVHADGSPSPMLLDRLETGTALCQEGAAPKLLMSGDHGRENYNEVQTMKDIAMLDGVPSEDIFMDHAGFSTYDSMYRARDIFRAKKVIIVTQKYHLYRAIYIAQSLGLDAYGVPADTQRYPGQAVRDLREILARNKDFVTTLVKPKPRYLGDAIPISGNGNATND